MPKAKTESLFLGELREPINPGDLSRIVETTKGQDVILTDITGGTKTGKMLGHRSYDKGTTVIGNSVMLEYFPATDEYGDTVTSIISIPPQTISDISKFGAEVVQLPGNTDLQ